MFFIRKRTHKIVFLSEAKDSLEEISLKLINSFLQEKSELEDQYAQVRIKILLNYF